MTSPYVSPISPGADPYVFSGNELYVLRESHTSLELLRQSVV